MDNTFFIGIGIDMTHWLRTRGVALAVVAALAGCGGDGGGTGTDAGNPQDSGGPADVPPASPCGPTGVFGTFTSVNGGQSGVMACGHTFTSFTGATITLTPADGGGARLTVTGTGSIGDTMDCPAMVDSECHVTAPACPSGSSSTVGYTLTAYAHQLTGTAHPSVGDCAFTYSIDGTR